MTRFAAAVASTLTCFLILAGCGGRIEEVVDPMQARCGNSPCDPIHVDPPEPQPLPPDQVADGGTPYIPYDSSVPVDPGLCTLVPGTYAVHFFEEADGGLACPVPPDQTETITAADLDASAPGCVTVQDTNTCTTTVDCTTDSSGYTTTTHEVVTTKDGHLAGVAQFKTTRDSDGMVIQNCPALEFTYTKN